MQLPVMCVWNNDLFGFSKLSLLASMSVNLDDDRDGVKFIVIPFSITAIENGRIPLLFIGQKHNRFNSRAGTRA